MEIQFGADQNGSGATGFSSLSRGLAPTLSIVPSISNVPMGGERTINPREGMGLTRDGSGRTVASPGRTIVSRAPISRDSGLRPVDPQPIFEPALEPRGLGNTRPPMTARDMGGRTIALPSGVSGSGDNAGTNQPRSPFDEQIDALFRGYFGEPVRGRSDKSGEFVYFPPPSASGGLSGGTILLLVAGLGVAGYYAYKKFGQGG